MQKTTKTSWKPLLHLLKKSRLPWLLYILQGVIIYFSTNLAVYSVDIMGEITAGAIEKPGLIQEFISANVLTTLASLVPIFVSYVLVLFEQRIQIATWKSFIDLPIRIYEKLVPSSLISRVTQDSILLGTIVDDVITLFSVVYFTGFSLYTMFFYSSSLTLLILPVVLVYAIFFIFGSNWVYTIHYYLQESIADLTGYFSERLANMKLIKVSGTEDEEFEAGQRINQEKFKVDISKVRYEVFLSSFQQFIDVLLTGLVLIRGNILVQQGQMNLEDLISFYMFSSMMPHNFQMIFQTLLQMQGIKGSTSSVAEISDLEKEVITREQGFKKGEGIVFKDVHFAYKEGDDQVLKGLTASIPFGQSTAIIGASGCGKTTLLKLIERFYEPDQGEILLDGVNINRIHLDEWRQSFGYIIQNSPLLSGTIRENLLYGARGDVSAADVEDIVCLTKLDEFLPSLEQGLDTDIGDMGMKLSGGQRQRVAIARALISRPEILLLDEATANIDAVNETAITTNLMDFMAGKTMIIVAHNLKTILKADQIILLEDGQVAAQGTHEELYRTSPLYQRFIQLQEAVASENDQSS